MELGRTDARVCDSRAAADEAPAERRGHRIGRRNPESASRRPPCDHIILVGPERERAEIIDRFKDPIRAAPQVLSGYYVTGDVDFVLVITAEDIEQYRLSLVRFQRKLECQTDQGRRLRWTGEGDLRIVHRRETVQVAVGKRLEDAPSNW